MLYSREIPVKYTADVCVIGGGPTGIAAAIAAARQGASVFLAESQGCFGGAGTSGLVTAFTAFTDGVNFMCGGIGREVYDKLLAAGAKLNGRSLPYQPEVLKKIYDDMILEAGVQFLFFTNLADVIAENGKVSSVILAAKSGLMAVSAKTFIDCTGDGDLCAMAGAPFAMGDEQGRVMGATLCSMWMNIDWKSPTQAQNAPLEKAFADGLFTHEDRHLPGIFPTGEQSGMGNLGHIFQVNSTQETELTRAMLEGRQLLPEFIRYYNEYVGGGFTRAYPVTTAATLGVRESRRILGDYSLNFRDYQTRAVFDDEIGRFSYPIDMHVSAATMDAYRHYYDLFTAPPYADGETYGIPYRCLTPKSLDNMWVGGRCISTDKYMQASIRVMPCCFITGQAIGIAAAMCAKAGKSSRKLDVHTLQGQLVNLGAYLPNYK